jgi:hypothetical protein
MTAMQILGILAAAAALVAGGLALLAWLRMRGTRVITCPETRAPAAVELDLGYGAFSTALGRPHFRLRDCSRWPERAGCGQMCLGEIEEAPDGCLVKSILTRWYEGKVCVYCRRTFGDVKWHDHRPALKAPDGRLHEWREIPPEMVPIVLGTHRPVCWDCHVTETFRLVHPELVVERPHPNVH